MTLPVSPENLICDIEKLELSQSTAGVVMLSGKDKFWSLTIQRKTSVFSSCVHSLSQPLSLVQKTTHC